MHARKYLFLLGLLLASIDVLAEQFLHIFLPIECTRLASLGRLGLDAPIEEVRFLLGRYLRRHKLWLLLLLEDALRLARWVK